MDKCFAIKDLHVKKSLRLCTFARKTLFRACSPIKKV